MHALLLEDDTALRRMLHTFLCSLDFKVSSFDEGKSALDALEDLEFDVFILDINVPNINGLELLAYIRQRFSTAKVLMITAESEIATFVKAYEKGCNEYIRKPFELKELEVRLKNLLNIQTIQALSSTIRFDLSTNQLQINKETVILSLKEQKLLNLLVRNKEQLVTTNMIEQYVWDGEIKESYRVRQIVQKLRSILGKDFIQTVPKQGYFLKSE